MLFLSISQAAVIVDEASISVSGTSFKDSTGVYGGIASTVCTGDGTSTCNSCTDATVPAKSCNQSSVYPALNFSVSFKVNAAVTNASAKLFIESATAGSYTEIKANAVQSYSQNDVVTLTVPWSTICNQIGLGSTCTASADVIVSRGLKFGVGAANAGNVDVNNDTKQLAFKFHYMAPASTSGTQSFCANTSTGVGVCNISFFPGDRKAYIDKALFNGSDNVSGISIDWESIAIFPLQTNIGSEAAAYSTFSNNKTSPVFRSIDASGNIPDSQISGLENYRQYCMVYGMRNKAQNIYKFVTADVAASVNKGCVTPTEVIGVLDDKSCFISTAAFGSVDAVEVRVFRQFRDRFLRSNVLGRVFIRSYYELSPPLAAFIEGNESLKTLTRFLLYPLLIFAYSSLHIGLLPTVFLFGLVLFLTYYVLTRRRAVGSVAALMLLLLLLPVRPLQAEVKKNEQIIAHPLAKEGLVRIKKDGTYVYKVDRKVGTDSTSLRVGQASQPNITISVQPTDASGNATGPKRDYNFSDLYGSNSGYLIEYNYERFFTNQGGRLGAQAGVSAMFASGQGKLVYNPDTTGNPNSEAKESYTFVTLPLQLGAVYRLEVSERQTFVPYGAGGGTYVVLMEKREDVATPKFAGGFGFYGAGGLMLNMGAFDSEGLDSLEREHGITNFWLTLEFKVIEVTGAAFGFSNRYLNAGLSFDF